MDIRKLKAERLKEARAKAGFDKPGDAAKRHGWGEAGYRHHENETRGFGADAAHGDDSPSAIKRYEAY